MEKTAQIIQDAIKQLFDVDQVVQLTRPESNFGDFATNVAMQLAKTMRADQSILVNLSGRGDKDIGTVADLSHADFYCRPSCQGQAVKGSGMTGAVEQIVKRSK